MAILTIIITSLVALLTTFTSLKRNSEDIKSQKISGRFFSKFTFSGYVTAVLMVVLIVIQIISYLNQDKQSSILKNEDFYAEIVITANSQEVMDTILTMLDNEIFVNRLKLGYDNIKFEFKKESPNPGAKGLGSVWLTLHTTSVTLDSDYRFDSNTIQQLNNKSLNGQIPEISKIKCRFGDSVYISFQLWVRNKRFSSFYNCNEYLQIKLGGLE